MGSHNTSNQLTASFSQNECLGVKVKQHFNINTMAINEKKKSSQDTFCGTPFFEDVDTELV